MIPVLGGAHATWNLQQMVVHKNSFFMFPMGERLYKLTSAQQQKFLAGKGQPRQVRRLIGGTWDTFFRELMRRFLAQTTNRLNKTTTAELCPDGLRSAAAKGEAARLYNEFADWLDEEAKKDGSVAVMRDFIFIDGAAASLLHFATRSGNWPLREAARLLSFHHHIATPSHSHYRKSLLDELKQEATLHPLLYGIRNMLLF